jgi:hypothetical protein
MTDVGFFEQEDAEKNEGSVASVLYAVGDVAQDRHGGHGQA